MYGLERARRGGRSLQIVGMLLVRSHQTSVCLS